MSVLLQISDTHFGTEQEPVMQALQQLHTAVQPEVVVVSGDITQRATPSQFRAAKQFFDSLKPRNLLAIPGNHDIPLFNPAARFLSPYGHYQRAFGANLQPTFQSEDMKVICVKTTRRWRHKHGVVSSEQIDQVAQQLTAANATQLRVVVTHQPVHIITDADRINRLRGYEPALRAWAQAGADIILGGHIHLPYVRPLQPLLQRPDRLVWAVQAGTAISRRVRSGMPNSVNVVRYQYAGGARTCHVEQWDFIAQHGAFQLIGETPLQLDRRA